MGTEPRKVTLGGGTPYTRRAGRGSSMWYMGCLFTVLAASEDTEGRFGLLEMVVPKGREPSRHLHRHDDEGFYVGEEVYEAGPFWRPSESLFVTLSEFPNSFSTHSGE